MRVLDLSNHDYATFDPACLRAAGVERVILGCWDFAIAEAMLLALRAHGIVAEDLYCFLYYRLPWENNDVLNATVLHERHGGIERVWLDCEAEFDGPGGLLDTEAPGTTVALRQEITQSWYTTLEREGYQAGIYTGRFWWADKMGDDRWFAQAGAPLWLANYGTDDPDNPRRPVTEADFGGWTRVAVHQYSSSIPVCGRGRDHNYWFLEEPMTPEEKAAFAALKARLEALELATFSGAEDRDDRGKTLPREKRLERARPRIDKRANGEFGSVADRSESAIALAQRSSSPAAGTKFTVEVVKP